MDDDDAFIYLNNIINTDISRSLETMNNKIHEGEDGIEGGDGEKFWPVKYFQKIFIINSKY